MRHTCDEACIHTIAAKIVNRAYPIDAVSVFWVGDFLSRRLKAEGIEYTEQVVLNGDVHNFTTIWEYHYMSPRHGEVYAYQTCGRVGLDDWACCVVLTRKKLDTGMAIRAIMAGSEAYSFVSRRKILTEEEIVGIADRVRWYVEKSLEGAPEHIKRLLRIGGGHEP
jgi:hypothetical protein